MASATTEHYGYGRLCVALDGKVHNYALAPEATLADVTSIFETATPIDSRRLRSIEVTIVTEPSSTG